MTNHVGARCTFGHLRDPGKILVGEIGAQMLTIDSFQGLFIRRIDPDDPIQSARSSQCRIESFRWGRFFFISRVLCFLMRRAILSIVSSMAAYISCPSVWASIVM